MRIRFHFARFCVTTFALLFVTYQPVFAAEKEAFRHAASIYTTSNIGGFELLGRLSEKRYWLASTQLSLSNRKSERNRSSRFFSDYRSINERDSVQGKFVAGIRQYFERSTISPFIQPWGGAIIEKSVFNSYRSSIDDSLANRKISNSLGIVIGCSFGIEYFLTQRISMSGIYSLHAEYLNWSLGGNASTKRFFSYTSNWVTMSYYWE